jgi:MoCo/4Fe-4S cofactor protein with predicted Tat translocation signal
MSAQPRQWRSLDELAGDPRVREWVENEFAPGVSEWNDPLGRRELLKLLGATLGLAGLTGCVREPVEKIVPYVRAPEDVVPGRPLMYATSLPFDGVAQPVLVESHMGRPTKVEGNPEHPASLGATSVFAQADILSLYDPDRAQVVVREGRISSWVAFAAMLGAVRESHLARKGEGLRILTGSVTSPSLAAQIRQLLARFPQAKWHQYDPAGRAAATLGARLAFGEPLHAVYRIDQADVIVSLDADFLYAGAAAVRAARDFAARRDPAGKMNRLYVVEPAPTVTGGMADHRLALASSDVENLARALAAAAGVGIPVAPANAPAGWIKAAAADLAAHRGSSLVLAGDQQPPAVHALAQAINAALGNIGRTVVFTAPIDAEPVDPVASISELAADMEAGRVGTLVMLGGNPVYNAPADLRFAERLNKVGLRVHLSLYDDETSELCHWHVPQAHALESWDDGRSADGLVTFTQPLIAPLYAGRSPREVLSLLGATPDRADLEILKEYWRAQVKTADFDAWWDRALHDGFVNDSAPAARTPTLRRDFAGVIGPAVSRPEGLEIAFRPDPTVWDGQWSNNGWLQELPKPLTKLTWDNAALISPRTAERLGVASGDVIELAVDGRTVRASAWILPGAAGDTVVAHLGYGRWRGGSHANGAGFSASALRASAGMGHARGLTIRKTGEKRLPAVTQEHHSMEGRHLARAGTIGEYRKDPHFAQHMTHEPKLELPLYPEFTYEGYAWGMTIDLNACTGCGACTIACQAENNIPIVGRREVARGREMHWIRVDRYFEGTPEAPAILHQPVACVHCENAPCEVVCPVAATAHSSEGLNQMVYNRCVGTRYCANNCPYKVRRFNFFLYSDWTSASLEPLRNPDVTVRSRGVMEKCTYCVQRINAARIDSEKEGRKIKDGDIVTACQAVCPSRAIVFGDINDPASRVAKLKGDARNYGLLTELNTKPRTSYLARVRNPNPELG